MRHILPLLLLFIVGISAKAQNISITSQSITTAAPTSCTNTFLSVSTMEGCINYSYTGSTVTVVGNTVTVQLDWTVGFICLGAINYGTYSIDLGQLPSGINAITTSTYLNGTFNASSGPLNVNVASCCGAQAAFIPSQTTVCQFDSISVINNSVNADSVIWLLNGVLVDTAYSPVFTFDSIGTQELVLVAFTDTCSDTSLIPITVVGLPNVTFGNDTVICENEVLTYAFPGYSTYLWSDGYTQSTNSIDTIGSLWVEVSNSNGCMARDTVNVTAILAKTDVDLGPDAQKCPGQPYTLTSLNTHQSYTWFNGATGVSTSVNNPGSYWLEALDAGFCVNRDTIVITEFELDQIVFVEDSNKCGSNEISLTETYSNYSWSNGSIFPSAQVQLTSLLFLTVTDVNGCIQSDSFLAEVLPLPNVNLGNDTFLCGENAIILGSGAQGQHIWSTGSQTSIIVVTQIGEYWVEVTAANGCSASDTISVETCVGINETRSLTGLYPNPASDKILFDVSAKFVGSIAVIYNLNGQLISRYPLVSEQNYIDVSSFEAGVYMMQIEGDVTSHRFVVARK